MADDREVIVPKDEADWLRHRAVDLTSTEVAALFGVSPYATLFEVWHRKKNSHVVEVKQNDRMKWGTRLQDSIANGIAQDEGWKIRRMDEYVRIPALKMGASFDFAIEPDQCECGHRFNDHSPIDGCLEDPDGPKCSCGHYVEVGQPGLLEIKNVDSLAFRDGWLVDGDTIEAPPHIELQVQHQLLVSGRAFAYIGALVGGNRVVLLKRERNDKVIDAIKSQCASFWMTIAMGKEPVPDFARDAAVIGRLYGYAEVGKVLNARGDAKIERLLEKYKQAADREKEAGTDKDAAKAELLTLIGDAEKVHSDICTISCGMIAGGPVSYERKPYRNFKPSWKKAAVTA